MIAEKMRFWLKDCKKMRDFRQRIAGKHDIRQMIDIQKRKVRRRMTTLVPKISL